MLRSAMPGAAEARAIAMATALCIALVTAACGGQPAAGGAAAAATKPAAPLATTAASGGAAPGGAQAQIATVTAAALDTSTWLLKPPFYAAGDEPFWRLDIVDGWFSFKRSGLPEIETPMVQPKKVGGADVFEATTLTVKIKREACETDGAGHADVSATVTFDGTDFDGCAFTGQSASASPEAGTVIDALPQIDMCLAKLGEPALVTAVYPREGDRTAVGLRSKDGSIYECAVEPGGKVIAYLDTIEPGAAGSWMSRMRFLRAGSSETTKCADAEDVKSGDKVVGRLLSKKCKF
jgi:uncharacterized membrane protein